ncbi:hypothetical protein HII36_06335 [Nonomuraea sp. NN258]|uniref:hypothetical protein n=1 Tax=Nonomuraea antri TaxID=2730852 RepID=UPI001568054A|nr:hypothetical protein [Nonomuraea antri]NRQ31459.1 hypothetical protein [Nonomuraea antri]
MRTSGRIRHWVVAAFLIVLVPASLWATSLPGTDFGLVMLLGPAWLVFVPVWAALFIFTFVGRWGCLRREWPRWTVAPLAVVLAGALIQWGVPVQVRFELSRAALDRFATSVARGAPPPDGGWIGLYPVLSAERVPGGASFTIEGAGGFLEAYGLVWKPGGGLNPDDHRRIDGDWYVWWISD